MKTKQFSKKLELNKETVTHLDVEKMNALHGGIIILTQKVTVCNTQCWSNCTPCW